MHGVGDASTLRLIHVRLPIGYQPQVSGAYGERDGTEGMSIVDALVVDNTGTSRVTVAARR